MGSLLLALLAVAPLPCLPSPSGAPPPSPPGASSSPAPREGIPSDRSTPAPREGIPSDPSTPAPPRGIPTAPPLPPRGIPSDPPLPYDRPPPPLVVPRIPFASPSPLPALAHPPALPGGPLDLPSAIGLALQRNPRVRTAVAQVEAQVGRIWEAASGYQPQVRLQYVAQRYQQPLGVPFLTNIIGREVIFQAAPFTITQFEERLQLQQLLSDGGRTRVLVRQAVDSARAAYASLAWETCTLSHDVRVAWLDVSEAAALVEVAREVLKNAEEHLELTRASYRAGDAARADTVYATTPTTRARMSLRTAQAAVLKAHARLNELIGSDPAQPHVLSEAAALPDIPADLATARSQAQRCRQDLVSLRQLSSARRRAMDAARRSRSVNISAQADYRTLGYGTQEVAPPHSGWSAGLVLSYPLLDGGLITSQVEQARAEVHASESREDALARQVDAEVVRAWLDLEQARDKVGLGAAEVAEATEALAMARGQYEAGVTTIITVLDAQLRLQRARVDEVNARHAVQRAHARLLLVTGR